MVINASYFILKALFVLKIFKFLCRLFSHVEKTAWLEKLISKFMNSQLVMSGCHVINVKVILSFQSSCFPHPQWLKMQDKNSNIFRMRKTFKTKYKAFFIIFKGLSVTKICLRLESAPLGMLSSYPVCNIHLILKLFVGLIYIKIVPCTTLDPIVGYSICDDVNFDEFFINQGGWGVETFVSLGNWYSGRLITLCTLWQIRINLSIVRFGIYPC